MRSIRALVTISVTVVLASCATTQKDSDDLCGEMAAFANATKKGGKHTVRVMTDWSVYEIACQRENDAPSRRLCGYLVKHMSIEFAEANVKRALQCIGVEASDDDRVPASASANSVLGKRVRAELLVEFARASDTSLPTLSITATGPVSC